MSISSDSPAPAVRDEWVKVGRRKGRRLNNQTQGHSSKQPTNTSSVPIPSAPSLTAQQVKQDYDRFAGQWRSSPACARLQDVLSSNEPGIQITKAICFGLGTFDPADGSWDIKRKAHVQLAAFLSIVEHVALRSGQSIPCLFQDPVFNAVDKDFIHSLGHKVVESPVGFESVDASTLAFGIHLYRDIYSRVIARHTPAMFVGTPYDVWEDSLGTENLDWDRMKALDRQCAKAKFPENDGETTFSSTAIHQIKGDLT